MLFDCFGSSHPKLLGFDGCFNDLIVYSASNRAVKVLIGAVKFFVADRAVEFHSLIMTKPAKQMTGFDPLTLTECI